jgi:hypothetical protein
MGWADSLSTHVWIFSVGRGIAAFVRTGLNQGFIIDAGSSNDFDPPTFIKRRFLSNLDNYEADDFDIHVGPARIAQVILSHPHEDHITYCREFSRNWALAPALLTCPHHKEPTSASPVDEKFNWEHIGELDDEIHSTYKSLYEDKRILLPLRTILFTRNRNVPNLEYGIYYLLPPVVEKIHGDDHAKYTNATSIMFYLRQGNHSVLFPGDMTPEGMERILADVDKTQKRFTVFDLRTTEAHPKWHWMTEDQPSLGSLLKQHGLTILVAPHHGLESCFCEKLYEYIKGGKPALTIISDRRHKKDAKGEVDERYDEPQWTAGLDVDIEGKLVTKNAVSTEVGHHILAVFSGTGRPRVFLDRSCDALLKKLD